MNEPGRLPGGAGEGAHAGHASDAVVGAREALRAAVGLLLALWIGKHLARVTPLGDVIFTGIAAYQLYVPLWLIQRRGETPEAYGIHAHGVILGPVAGLRRLLLRLRRRRRPLRLGTQPLARLLAHYGRGARFEGRPFLEDIGRAVVVGLLTFPAFLLGHHVWQTLLGHTHLHWGAPPDLHIVLLKNVFLIALPEELFYRGFIEHRLERRWPTSRFLLAIPVGRTVVVAAALFALGHFLGEYNPARLGPFFPAFLFSLLTRKSGSITGAIVYHGCSNAISYVATSWYA
jgi:hypothetical protein